MEGQRSTIGADRVIFAIAGRQHGVVSRAQLLASAVGEGAIEGRIAKGALRPIHRGVYAVAGRPLAREGQWLAAVLACGHAALSHWDAAELWGIVAPRVSRETHVSVPRNAKPRARRGIRIHRAALGAEVTERRGITVTAPARTLFDLSPLMPRRRLERALDEAVYLHLLPAGALAASLERNAGRRGSPAFRAVLAAHTPGTTRTRSELEERFLALCRSHELPQPLVNTRVAGLECRLLLARPGADRRDRWLLRTQPPDGLRARSRARRPPPERRLRGPAVHLQAGDREARMGRRERAARAGGSPGRLTSRRPPWPAGSPGCRRP